MDDIIEEVRRIREAYAEQFNYDIAAIFRDARERGRESGREVVSPRPRRIVPTVDIFLDDEGHPVPSPASTTTESP